MDIKIENLRLSKVYDLLYKLPLKGKQSRYRTRLLKLIQEAAQEVAEKEQSLLKEHCNLDADGNPAIIEDEEGQKYDVKDMEAFRKDKVSLLQDHFVIDGEDNQEMLATIKGILDDYSKDLSGQDAIIYDDLCTEFGIE